MTAPYRPDRQHLCASGIGAAAVALIAVCSLFLSACYVPLPGPPGIPRSLPSLGLPQPSSPSPPSSGSPSGGGSSGGGSGGGGLGQPSLLPPSSSGPPGGGSAGGGSGLPSGGSQGGSDGSGGGSSEAGDSGSDGEGSASQGSSAGGGAGGSGSDPGDRGWVLSNELPDTAGTGDGGEGAGGDGDGGDGSESDTATGTEAGGGGGGAGDHALTEVLEDLDGQILEQQVPTRKGDQGLAGGSAGGSGDPEDTGAAPSGEPNQPPVARIPERIPPDRPDARDDDVVARQLREAAMAEKDPELRESLWEEYERYKSGL